MSKGPRTELVSFRELVSAMAQPQQPPQLKIDPLAQAMELRDRFDRAHAPRPAPLKPGDLVQARAGLSPFSDAPAVLIIWRLLDITDPQDTVIITDAHQKVHADRMDVMVGRLLDDGTLLMVPMESWRFEPYEGRTE